MSDKIGMLSFSEERSPFRGLEAADGGFRTYSEEAARVIDEEVHALVAEAYGQVQALLSAHQPTLDRLAQELRRQERLDTKHLLAILADTGVDPKQLPTQAGQDSAGNSL